MIEWGVVRPAASITRAIPKSVRRTSRRPSWDCSRMLSGLTSRCTTPSPCASASADATWASSRAASAGASVPCARRRSRRLPPATKSITSPSDSPALNRSRTPTMFSWRSIIRIVRSCTKRVTSFGWRSRPSCSSLTATCLPEARSMPRHTVPVAPCPTGQMRMYEFPTHRPLRSTVAGSSRPSTCAEECDCTCRRVLPGQERLTGSDATPMVPAEAPVGNADPPELSRRIRRSPHPSPLRHAVVVSHPWASACRRASSSRRV